MASLEYPIGFLSEVLNLPLYSVLLIVALFVIFYRLIKDRLLLTEVQAFPSSEGNRMEFTGAFRPVVVESNGQKTISQLPEKSMLDSSRTEESIQTVVPPTEGDPRVCAAEAATKRPVEDILQSVQPFPSTRVQESTNATEHETCDGLGELDCKSPVYFQLVFLGDSGVGKTSFMRQYCASYFEERLPSTVCIDLMTKKTSVDGLPVFLHLWDTAGQERFRSISMQYMRKADCIVIMYDMSREDTLRNVRDWLTSAEDSLGSLDRLVLGVVANKSDLLSCPQTFRRAGGTKRSQPIEDFDDDDDSDDDDDDLFRYMCLVEGKVLAEKLRAAFGICSSKTGRGISKFMKDVCRMLVERLNSSAPEKPVTTPGLPATSGSPVTPGLTEGVIKVQSKGRLEKMKNFECC